MSWEVVVTEENYYRRLDKFLRKNLPEVPLSAVYKFIRKGKVYVNGKRVKNNSLELEVGDRVSIRFVDIDKFRRRKENELVPQEIPLDIVYEDPNMIVLNKTAGIALHPGKNIHVTTLIEGLLYYGNEKGFQPHLVHRLDLNTSGALIVAKNKEAARILTDAFKRRLIGKEYIALVRGKTETKGVVDTPLDDQPAVTEYELISFKDDLSLIRVRIKTGRKHQIRRHMSIIGHHVVGDNKYGDKAFNREIKRKTGLKRQFLHCLKLSIPEGIFGKKMVFTAPLPSDLTAVLKKLRFEISHLKL